MHKLELPEPSADEILHSAELSALIKQKIQQAGDWIDFETFMSLALYAPGLGYYSAGTQKFGEQGDFITAPELSPLFARTLARPVAKIIEQMDPPDVLEFGAGSGVLAAELLTELNHLKQLPQHYYIIELSADLRQRQKTTLKQRVPDLLDRVVWLDSLPQQKINAVVIANEVLDAMPVQRFVIENGQRKTIGVAIQNNELVFATRKSEVQLCDAISHIEKDLGYVLTEAYQSEVNFNFIPWLQSLGDVLQQAVVLLIDYGYPRREYFLPERNMGTLMCYYRHRSHDNPLWYPGLQDMTAFVDFTAVAEAAMAADFTLEGFTSQAGFLMENGIADVLEQQSQSDQVSRLKLSQQMKTLLLPSEMGERFKVMGLSKNFAEVVPGFSSTDLTSRL
ncbi:MAG TPA: SAM-dependent methyltransferase [Gammaproteobacteria bacterium]